MKIGVAEKFGLFFVFACFLLPHFVHAQLVVSEIMYDLKTGSDSGREWIEVFNASDGTIHLPEWSVEEGGSDHGIVTAQGGDDLAPGAYAVLADNPAKFEADWPGYSGQLFDTAFSGGLSNSGESVAVGYVKNKIFTPTDTVVYSSAWGGSGDGNTLQRAASDTNVFAGAVPTPGTGSLLPISGLHAPDLSATADTSTTQSDQTASTTATTSQVLAPVSSYVAPPMPDLYADAGADRTVIVGADATFDARAYDKNQNTVDTARFSWNFGDGATAEGESVLHHFDYPGRYAVILTIAQDKFAAADEVNVTAQPAQLAFSIFPDGGAEIDNKAGRDLDLSGWIVRQAPGVFAAQFLLPQHSMILSGSSMHISKTTLQFAASSSTELDYPNGVPALDAGQSMANAPTAPVLANTLVPPPVTPAENTVSAAPDTAATPDSDTANASQQIGDSISVGAAIDADSTTSLETAAAAGAPASGSHLWWFAAIGLAAIAAATLAAARYFGKGEWDIVEEK